MRHHKILVMDSGVGGLSVMQEVIKKLPGLSVDYLADHAYFPYGSKTPSQLIDRVSILVNHLCANTQDSLSCYSLVVIACNSASTVVLDHLRLKFDIPFVGVVPAIKPACSQSVVKRVGLLATEGTVQRDYTHDLIRTFGSEHQITLVGSSELVAIAEGKLAGEDVDIKELRAILEPFKAAKVDTIVLGCTHFPLVKDELVEAVDWPIVWVDSGEAIANRVCSLFESTDGQLDQYEVKGNDFRFLSTAMPTLPDTGWIKQHFKHIIALDI